MNLARLFRFSLRIRLESHCTEGLGCGVFLGTIYCARGVTLLCHTIERWEPLGKTCSIYVGLDGLTV